MRTLPDLLEPGLRLVFVGLNPSEYSAREGYYFANPRNRFWPAFNRSSLLPGALGRECTPADAALLLEYGIGFTDVVKRPTPQGSGLKAADYPPVGSLAARQALGVPAPAGLLPRSDGLQVIPALRGRGKGVPGVGFAAPEHRFQPRIRGAQSKSRQRALLGGRSDGLVRPGCRNSAGTGIVARRAT